MSVLHPTTFFSSLLQTTDSNNLPPATGSVRLRTGDNGTHSSGMHHKLHVMADISLHCNGGKNCNAMREVDALFLFSLPFATFVDVYELQLRHDFGARSKRSAVKLHSFSNHVDYESISPSAEQGTDYHFAVEFLNIPFAANASDESQLQLQVDFNMPIHVRYLQPTQCSSHGHHSRILLDNPVLYLTESPVPLQERYDRSVGSIHDTELFFETSKLGKSGNYHLYDSYTTGRQPYSAVKMLPDAEALCLQQVELVMPVGCTEDFELVLFSSISVVTITTVLLSILICCYK